MTKTLTDVKVHEALGSLGDSTSLPDGQARFRIRIIESDVQGSTGYYPRSVVESDGPSAFPKGTHMHLDHQSWMDWYDAPAGSLKDFAAVIDSTPVFEEAAGDKPAGLYADIKVFSQYALMIKEVAPHIGVSIDAIGRGEEGMVNGVETIIFTELFASELNRVDFVTHPGAGGRIITALESKKIKLPEGARLISEHPNQKARENQKPRGKSMDELTEKTGQDILAVLKEVAAGIKTQETAAKAAADAEEKRLKEAGEVDLVEVIESAVDKISDADLPKAVRTKVIESVSRGVAVDVAIKEWAELTKQIREGSEGESAGAGARVVTRGTEGRTSTGRTKEDLALAGWGIKGAKN